MIGRSMSAAPAREPRNVNLTGASCKADLAELEDLFRHHALEGPRVAVYPHEFPGKIVAKARRGFAQSMTDNEIPLLLLGEEGFWPGQVKPVLLITNQRIYCTGADHPISLSTIETVHVEDRDVQDEFTSTFVGEMRMPCVVVNGTTIVHGKEPRMRQIADLVKSLSTLAGPPAESLPSAARQSLYSGVGERPVAIAHRSNDRAGEAAKMLASCVCGRRAKTDSVVSAVRMGLDENRAGQIFDEMTRIYSRPRARQHGGTLAAGVIVGVISGIMAAATSGGGPPNRLLMIPCCIGFCVAVFAAGKMMRRPSSVEILATWRKENNPLS